MNAIQKFWSLTDKSGDCWVWQGTCNLRTGRAYFKIGDKASIAARWIWQEENRALVPGECILHRCDNVKCVRPDHLFVGTQIENIADRDKKGRNRLAATHCVNGHEFTEANTRSYGPQGKWRMCRACARENQRAYRTKLEAENY